MEESPWSFDGFPGGTGGGRKAIRGCESGLGWRSE
jgi:hypothetical protein